MSENENNQQPATEFPAQPDYILVNATEKTATHHDTILGLFDALTAEAAAIATPVVAAEEQLEPAKAKRVRRARRTIPVSEPAQYTLMLLSELIAGLSAEDTTGVLSRFVGAVRDGHIVAVRQPHHPRCEAQGIGSRGRSKTLHYEDEVVLMDDAWHRWLGEVKRLAQIDSRMIRGDHTATIEELRSGLLDIREIHNRRMAHILKKARR